MRRILKGLVLGCTIGLAGCLFGLSTFGTLFERGVGLDWLFHIRGAIAAPPEVAIVAIDSRTGPRLELSALTREWPRSIHGKLVDGLVERGASVIVFDIDFHKPRSVEDEAIFAEAARRSKRVVLFQHLTGKRQPVEDASGKIRGTVWVEELVSPVTPLAEAARGLGPFPLPKIEAAVYEFWVFKSSAREAPTMPATGFQVHALKVYDAFYRLLHDSGIGEHFALPESAARISSAADLLRLMTSIRRVISEQPAFAGRLVEELNKPWVKAESAETRRLLHSLVSMYIGRNERLLNFYGPPGTIRTIPYHAVINGADANISAQELDLTNTIVFVGFSDLYDPGQVDRFYTVFTDKNSIDLSGVEIAATAFGNLLHDESIRTPGGIDILAILFCFGLVITLVIYFTPASLGIPIAIAVILGYGFFAQIMFNDSQLWLPLATPVLLQFPFALFTGLLAQYLQQRHKVRHISEAISLYVPAEVSRALTGGDLDPDNINKVTFSTCLATDMQGFSTIAEQLGPGELAEFLNDYFDTLAKPLSDHDVSITEFRADAIMCAWTGDETDIEVRRKPILASLQAADAIEDFKARHDAFETALRIGLSTGEVYVGHSGGGGHFVYSIVGDCANTASRIEGLNKQVGSQILATDSTIEGIDGLLLRPIGQFVFVGKTEALPILEIISTSSDATARQRELCERFSQGIEWFTACDWKRASADFKSILKDYPHDGPSRFYMSHCQQRLKAETLPENPWVINLAEK
jgi:adenylate cyclase